MRPALCFCLIALLRPALAQTGVGTATRAYPLRNDPVVRTEHGTGIMRLLEIVSPGSPQQPLTQKQRFFRYLMRTVGPVPIVLESGVAGFDQGLDRPPEWRLGAAGYGKRFANVFAYNGVRQSLMYGVSSLLGEDTSYFSSGLTGAWPRTAHALRSTLTARRNGREVLSISAITGVVGASLISRAWVPPSWRHGKNVGVSIGLTLAGMAGFNIVREFLPDLLRQR